jgi:hypothetical protein
MEINYKRLKHYFQMEDFSLLDKEEQVRHENQLEL